MCDKCAASKKQCSSCCEDMETANLQYNRDAAEKSAKGASSEPNGKEGEVEGDDEDEDDDEGEEQESGDDNKHEGTEKTEVRSVADSSSSSSVLPSNSSTTSVPPAVPSIGFGEVDDRKFAQTVASKYSKDRKVGTVDDTNVFQFGESSSKPL